MIYLVPFKRAQQHRAADTRPPWVSNKLLLNSEGTVKGIFRLDEDIGGARKHY
jgi:hypothetical protein